MDIYLIRNRDTGRVAGFYEAHSVDAAVADFLRELGLRYPPFELDVAPLIAVGQDAITQFRRLSHENLVLGVRATDDEPGREGLSLEEALACEADRLYLVSAS